MIIQRITGGLGNQLFQYAYVYSASRRLNQSYLLDVSYFLNYALHNGYELEKVFMICGAKDVDINFESIYGINKNSFFFKLITHPRIAKFKPLFVSGEKGLYFDSKLLRPRVNSYCVGYYQSEKYFEDYSDELKNLLRFNEKQLDAAVIDLASTMKSFESASIHIRRGDYVSDARNRKTIGFVGKQYLQSSIDYIYRNLTIDCFYVFSDDIDWAKSELNFEGKVFFVEGNYGEKSYMDMYLMSSCKHHIISNSTFSWWAAWLGEREDSITVAPKNWFANGAANDIVPDRWLKL